jgi:hypothetical protein
MGKFEYLMMENLTMSSTIETTKKKNPFTFNKEFKREFDCVMKVYDETFSEFHKVTSSTTVDVPDEYGVCNNNYKLRFITPTNISSFISYIMKALKNQLIKPNIGDMEKFAVATAKQFIADNGCVPMEDSSIYATGDYSSDHMTLQDLLLLCENDVYHTGVCSKYDMAQRKASMKDDVSKIVDMHYGANMKKIVNALPTLFDKTDFGDMEYSERELIITYVETFILFATTLNCITMSNMILYCVPKSTYNTHAIVQKENDIKYNSLVADSSTVDSVVTECCLLKTNSMMLRNKIPFNINMRDIVLQDMHPNFKDTKSALHFILKDSRSPISQLLIKYGDEKKCRYIDPMVVINLFAHDTRCRFDCDKDFLACQYERTDFHTDVNWLDKIAYGNNYLNGNYRNDGVGNHNFTSMTTTLDTIYRMFGDCALNSSEELANHIMIVADMMNTVIRAYGECHIKNWDLVRDVLAVLGEIITRCMIKLYNNHMTVFVATDNMNDTDIPGYLYTESFVMEADDTKPKVVNDSGATGVKHVLQKAQTFITQLLHRFIAWVGEKLTKFNVKFFENHKIEFEWVKKNNKLNGEIEAALKNRTFTPTVTNYPNYKIPAEALIKDPISKIVNDLLTVNTKAPITPENIKARFYPDAVSAALGYKPVDTSDTVAADTQAKTSATPPEVKEESYVMRSYGSYMMEADENNDKTSKSNEREQEVLTNYILYGDVNHKPTSGQTQLDDKQWHSLYMDILQTNKLFDKSIKPIYDDLKKTLDDIQKRQNAVNAKLGSFSNNNNSEQAKQDNEEKAKAEQESKRLESMVKALQDIANSYDALLANVISQKFYRTSYTLYRDIVTAYNQQKSVDKSNSKQTTESFVDAIEGIGEIIV